MAIKYTAIVNGVEYGEYVDDIPQYCDIMNSVEYDEQTVMMAIHDALVTMDDEIKYSGLPEESISPRFSTWFIWKDCENYEDTMEALRSVKWEITSCEWE